MAKQKVNPNLKYKLADREREDSAIRQRAIASSKPREKTVDLPDGRSVRTGTEILASVDTYIEPIKATVMDISKTRLLLKIDDSMSWYKFDMIDIKEILPAESDRITEKPEDPIEAEDPIEP